MRVRGRSPVERATVLPYLFLLLAASAAHGQTLSDADARTLTDCRFIQDEHMRIACYDAVMSAIGGGSETAGEAPPKTAARIAPQSSPVPPATSAPMTQAAPPQLRPSAEAAQGPAPSAQTSPAEDYGLPASRRAEKTAGTITVQVAETGLAPSGKLRLTTTDGMIWDQSSGDPAKAPEPGTEVVISKGLMGSHWCQLDRWTSVRCERVDRPVEALARPVEPRKAAPQQAASASASSSASAQTPASPHVASAQPSDPKASYGLPQQENKNAVKQVTVEVASTGLSSTGKLRFVTTDGMVWEQTDGDPAPSPKQGSKVKITNGAMGSHWCQISQWTSVRCERSE